MKVILPCKLDEKLPTNKNKKKTRTGRQLFILKFQMRKKIWLKKVNKICANKQNIGQC